MFNHHLASRHLPKFKRNHDSQTIHNRRYKVRYPLTSNVMSEKENNNVILMLPLETASLKCWKREDPISGGTVNKQSTNFPGSLVSKQQARVSDLTTLSLHPTHINLRRYPFNVHVHPSSSEHCRGVNIINLLLRIYSVYYIESLNSNPKLYSRNEKVIMTATPSEDDELLNRISQLAGRSRSSLESLHISSLTPPSYFGPCSCAI